jgi:hypothetical protein
VAALGVLLALVLLDAALSGFRAAAGRSARIDKRRYYARAMLVGILAGAVLAAIVAGIAVQLGTWTSAPLAYWLNVSLVVARLVSFFTPVAATVLVLLGVRRIGSVDARSLASTLFFGPVTLLRPVVVAAGCAWAVTAGVRADVAILTCGACAGSLLLAPGLDRLAFTRPR